MFWFGLALGCVLAVIGGVAMRRWASFSAQRPEDYVSGAPLDIRQSLNGDIACDGVIYGPFGRVASRFKGNFQAQWTGDQGAMVEHFFYDSGGRQTRHWSLKIGPDGQIEADAPDLVGKGYGRQTGSAMVLRYRIRLDEDAGGHVLSVTDWIYTTPGGALVNRSQFRKFGFKVAELIATMRPA